MEKTSKKTTTTKAMKPIDKEKAIWGYVNATGRQSEIITEDGELIIETIHPYAFEETLQSGQPVKFRLNHQKMLGHCGQDLKLKEDNVGLYADGVVKDEETIGKIDRGEIAGWSLQFNDVAGGTSSWRDQQGIIHRDIYKLDLLEVSLIDTDNVPAYTATSIHSRANGDGRRTIYNFISGYEPMHSRALPMPQYMGAVTQTVPQYMVPQYMGVVPQSVPQYMVPQYMGAVPQSVPQYMPPQYMGVVPQSVPQYMVSMPSVMPPMVPQAEARKPVVPGASLEVKTSDKGNTDKEADQSRETKDKLKAEPEVETKDKLKAEPEVETKDEDNKSIDLSEIMKELSSDTDTIKKYYKDEV